MLCEQAAALIAARLDGELSDADHDALAAHLAACPDCRALDEAFRVQHTDLHTAFAPRRRAAAATAHRAVTRLHQPRRRWLWLGSGMLAAASIAGVCVALLVREHLLPNSSPMTEVPAGRTPASAPPPLAALTPRPLPPAPPTDRLAVGATVQTAAGEKKRLQLPDNSVLFVNQNTTAMLVDDRRLAMASGEVFIET